MKRSVVMLAAVILGFVTGSLLQRAKEERSSPAATAAEGTRAVPQPPGAGTAARASGAVDTIASLLELDDLELYPRLAAWLLDASGEEMAGFWTGYSKRTPGNWQVISLLLSQWTWVDPEAAIATMKDSPYERSAWRAWATHDSDAAMAAARGAAEFIRAAVIAGVCSVDPRRGLRLMEENPEFRSQDGIWEISSSLARKDPAAALDFRRGHGVSFGNLIFEDWAKSDPRAALEWLAKNPKRPGEEAYRTFFIEALERENPDLLAEIAATAPSGKLKRDLEAAAFRKLVKEDRQAALAMARSSESPRVAAERFAEVGLAQVKDDPQAALEVFGELLEAFPSATMYFITVLHPGGSSGSGTSSAGTQEFIDRLVKSDPAAALAIALEHQPAEQLFRHAPALAVSRSWAREDFDGYVAWVSAAPPESVDDQGLWLVAQGLADRKSFTEAMDWALRISPQNPRHTSWRPVEEVALRWKKADSEAARSWLEKAEVPDHHRKDLEKHLAPP